MFLGVPRSMIVRLGWTSAGYGGVQGIRLINNVVLARLLTPSIFGLMALITTIRTGVELLSDLGIRQNIVSNPGGADPKFYNTAWTLQVLRGLLLAIICLALAVPAAHFFRHPELASALFVAPIFFIFTGFDSAARGLVQKEMNIARMSMLEVINVFVAFIAQVLLAIITPTIWALIIGGIIGAASTLVTSYLLMPGLRHDFVIDRDSARQLFKFGKWVFLSSIVYFLAMNFDRLYFAKQITLSQLGIYGIARSLADMVSLFVLRASSTVLYPTVAAAGLERAALRQKLLRGRRTLLLGAAAALGAFAASSQSIVNLLYDPRYSEAGLILPILCVGVWFGILSSTSDSILMGLSRPAYPALSNAAKLVTYVVGVPLAFYFYGFIAAVAAISFGEIVKYGVLWAFSHKEHLHFGRDDFLLSLMFAATVVLTGEVLRTLGFGSGVEGLFSHLVTTMAG